MSPALTGESCMIWRLADDPAELGHAREVVRKALVGWALSEYAELAELVVTELATNALRHGAGPIDISLSFTGNELRTAVHDHGVGRPVRRPQRRPLLHAGSGPLTLPVRSADTVSCHGMPKTGMTGWAWRRVWRVYRWFATANRPLAGGLHGGGESGPTGGLGSSRRTRRCLSIVESRLMALGLGGVAVAVAAVTSAQAVGAQPAARAVTVAAGAQDNSRAVPPMLPPLRASSWRKSGGPRRSSGRRCPTASRRARVTRRGDECLRGRGLRPVVTCGQAMPRANVAAAFTPSGHRVSGSGRKQRRRT